MPGDPNVNALIEALENGPGPKREQIEVGRLLVYCQQVCPEWTRECGRYDTETWIRLMVTPGQRCDRWPR